jgi:hypothetical protein
VSLIAGDPCPKRSPDLSNWQALAHDFSLSPPRPSTPAGPNGKGIFSNSQQQLTDIKAAKMASNIFECLLFVTPDAS